MPASIPALVLLLLMAAAEPAVANEPSGRRVRLNLDVSGELFAPAGREAETVRQRIEVAGRFDFLETPATGDQGEPAAGATRLYSEATAEIRVDGQQAVTSLPRDARRLDVSLVGTTPAPFLRNAFLTRDETDLLETPFDSLLLDRLLPNEPVAIGDTWRIPADSTAGLLAIDTIENGELEAKLVEAADGVAKVSLAGVIDGAADGVPTHVIVEGTFSTAARGEDERYGLDGEITSVSAVIRERRQASHVAPGFEVEARLDVRVSPEANADHDQDGQETVAEASGGTAAARGGVEDSTTPTLRRQGNGRPGIVWHRDAEGRYDLVYDSRWRTVESTSDGLVMRMVDHGALVAQCSIAAMPRANADVTPGVAELKRDIERSLAGQFGRFEEANESSRPVATGDDITIVRVASTGTAEGLPFQWIHYVLTDAEGRRASVTFMLEASMRKRFADADRILVEGFEFVPLAAKEARLPRKTSVP